MASSADRGSRPYGHGNRAFLAALQARGTMTFEESRPIIAAIKNADIAASGREVENFRAEDVTEGMFREYLDAASRAVSRYDYEIRSTVHQVTKQRIYAFVNATSDPQTQLATTLSPDENAFVNRVLDAMFDTYNHPRSEMMCITQMQAVKLARPTTRRQSRAADESELQAAADKGVTHSQVEAVLADLVAAGWFEKSRDGFYSLAPRALLEMRAWLVDSFNDPEAAPGEWQRIKFCEACKEVVTHGVRCPEPTCTLRLHDICQEAYWRSRREKKCPKCEREWELKLYVGERAVTTTDAYQRGRRRGGARKSTLAEEIFLSQAMDGSEDSEGQADT